MTEKKTTISLSSLSHKLKTLLFDIHIASSKTDSMLSFIFTSLLFITFHCIYTICFETNDDILFAQLVHGYGIANATDFLPVSNVLVAYISQYFPSLFNIPGYIVFTIFLLFISCWMIVYYLLRINMPLILSIIISILFCLRPICIPQFTVTSGLLAINGILFFHLYIRYNDYKFLFFCGVFIFLSFILRSQMLFLTIFILFPLFLSKKVFNDNILRNFTILIIVICSVFAVIDHKVKKSPELYKYTEFLDAMIPILNYGYAQKLIANRDIPIKYGYSTNDLNLLASYFYITDKFTDTAVISKMIEELGASERINISEGISALKAFLHPSLLPLIILGMALLLLLPRQRNNSLKIISCLCLAFGCFFFIGAFGRPGRVRIMFPIAMAILLLPLMSVYIIEYKHKIVILLISLILCIYTFTYIHSKVINNTLLYSKACQYIIKLPIDEPIFSWGHAFPFEAVQPVLQGWPTNIDIRLFGGYTSAPFDKATNGGGGEFLDKMRSIEGVLTLDKGDRCEKFLKTFAQEYNFGCRVSCENEGRILPDTKIVRVRCK